MTKLPLQLLDDRILIDVDPACEMSPGGIHLPEAAQTRTPFGTVLAVGPGRFDPTLGGRVPMQVKRGDKVEYERMQGIVLEHEGKKYMVVREHSVVAVMG